MIDLRSRQRAIITAVVSECEGVSRDEIFGERRRQPVAHARQIAMAMTYECCPEMSVTQIARMYHKLDHTTVLFAVNKRRKEDFNAIYHRCKKRYLEIIASYPQIKAPHEL